MPAQHGVWLDDDQDIGPARPEQGKDQPERAVAVAKAGADRFAAQVRQLLAKGQVLDRQVHVGTEGGTQGSKKAQDQGNHRAMMHDGALSRTAGYPVIPTDEKQTVRMSSWRGTGVDTPFFQTGEANYGEPIIDRVITPSTNLADSTKCVLVSFDSTMRLAVVAALTSRVSGLVRSGRLVAVRFASSAHHDGKGPRAVDDAVVTGVRRTAAGRSSSTASTCATTSIVAPTTPSPSQSAMVRFRRSPNPARSIDARAL